MKFFTFAKASDLSLHEIVFLSDVSKDDRIFSVEGVPAFSLGETLAIRNHRGSLRLKIKAETGIYEVAASPWHKFAIYSPDSISVKNLAVGDKVLLRGNNALPDPFEDSPRPSCVSEVLEISKTRKSCLAITFGLSRPLVTSRYFAGLQLPLPARSKSVIRKIFAPDSKIEIPHGGLA